MTIEEFIGQAFLLIEVEIQNETECNRCSDLEDAKEYLRRAVLCLHGIPCEDNETSREALRKGGKTVWPNYEN